MRVSHAGDRGVWNVLGAVCALLLLANCQGLEDGGLAQSDQQTPDRPALYRPDGPRLPAFSGVDPARRGWTKVDGLLWIEASHAEAYAAGLVPSGGSFVSARQMLPPTTPADEGFRLRTDHLAVHTNASWAQASLIAREAEAHVTRLVASYGDALNLRLPQGPLKVIVMATRAEFEAALHQQVGDPLGWGAYYDARTGAVNISLEPAAHGALPWQADLRHELTHQVLDLSRPLARRGRPFPVPWFWLWEGIAVWSEGLGGGPTTEREARWRVRRARGEVEPIARLIERDATSFEGRHYDQAGLFVTWLLDPGVAPRQRATLDLVRDLLRGGVGADEWVARLGNTPDELERRWLDTVGR
ncbi:MAG: hypothetical protein O2894_04915 [Planctomycetota bacterium]|nr:hypothetical protein [Planctomycetota bacterium]